MLRRLIIAWLALLALVFSSTSAEAQLVRGARETRAKFSDPSIYVPISNCWRLPNKYGVISSTTVTNAAILLTCQNLDFDAIDPIVLIPNFYVVETGVAQTEVAYTTGFTVEAAGIKVQTAATTMTCTLTNGGVVDPAATNGGILAQCKGVIPAGALYDVRMALAFTANQSMPGGPKARTGTAEGQRCGNISYASWATGTATVAASGGSSCTFATQIFAPFAVVARGSDGRSAEYYRGDSICFSKGMDYTQFPNGAGGVVAIGMDSSANGQRLAGFNTCIASSRPQYGYSGDAGYLPTLEDRVHGLIDQITALNAGVQPFDRIIYQHGTNSVSGAYAPYSLFKTMMVADMQRERAWHNVPVIAATMLPTATSVDQFKTASSVATCTGSLNTSKVLTITSCASGTLAVGQQIQMGTYSGQITISSLGTGTGGAGTYNTSAGATITSTTVTAYNQIVGTNNRDAGDTANSLRWVYNDDLITTRLGGAVDLAVPIYLGLSADPTSGSRDRVKVHPWSSVTAAADAGSGGTLIVVGTCPALGSVVNLGGQAQTILTASYDGTNCTLTGTNTTGISGTWGARTAGTAVNGQYFADGQSATTGLHPSLEGYQQIAPWWSIAKAWLIK